METATGYARPEAGLCFGSQFLGEDGVRLFEVLPSASFRRIRGLDEFWMAWTIDIYAHHADNRQAVFKERPDGELDAYFIDHGHLLGGPHGDIQPRLLVSRYLDARVYNDTPYDYINKIQKALCALDADQIWREIAALPDEWKTRSGTSSLASCLNRLTSADRLESTINVMGYLDQQVS